MSNITIHNPQSSIAPEVLPVWGHAQDARNPVVSYINSLSSENSKETMKRMLRTVVALSVGVDLDTVTMLDVYRFDWSKLTYAHTSEIRARLMEGYSDSSVNLCLTAVRRVLKECWRLGHMTEEQRARSSDVQNIAIKRNTGDQSNLTGRALTSDELDALQKAAATKLSQPDEDGNRKVLERRAEEYRDHAIVSLFRQTGMRRAEMAALNRGDISLVTEGKHAGQWKVVIHGKGKKKRTNYIQHGQGLEKWLEVRGDHPGALFIGCTTGGRLRTKPDAISEKTPHLTPQSIYDMLQKRGKQAGIKDFTPHDLRRTFITKGLDKVDIDKIASIVGHSSTDTTRRYDRRGEDAKQDAASLFFAPSFID